MRLYVEGEPTDANYSPEGILQRLLSPVQLAPAPALALAIAPCPPVSGDLHLPITETK